MGKKTSTSIIRERNSNLGKWHNNPQHSNKDVAKKGEVQHFKQPSQKQKHS